ncbi:helix-turn-helix domain-containing protein [Burkholderia sp. 4M9327F10]|nr:helix-turn-helix domain-containing protein [Burkholderia sp. 4M9327F10]
MTNTWLPQKNIWHVRSVRRALSKFQKAGFIEVRGKQIRIVERSRLERI